MPDHPDLNAAQRTYWSDVAGPTWVDHRRLFDRMLEPHGNAVVDLLAATAGERVLDVGCGFGTTALDVARRVGPAGTVHAVDISPVMVACAAERIESERLANVTVAVGDAEFDAMGDEAGFDAVVSRFGVMFFADPAEAFANLRRHVRPGGRLAFVCWQEAARNPFFALAPRVIRPMLADPPPMPPPGAPGPLGLADPVRTESLLAGSGWGSVAIEPMQLAQRFDGEGGDGVATVVEHTLMSELGRLAAVQLSAAEMETLRSRLAAEAEQHCVDGVVSFDSNVWLVSAVNPG